MTPKPRPPKQTVTVECNVVFNENDVLLNDNDAIIQGGLLNEGEQNKILGLPVTQTSEEISKTKKISSDDHLPIPSDPLVNTITTSEDEELLPEKPPQTVVLNERSPDLGHEWCPRKPKGTYKLMNKGITATLAKSLDEDSISLNYTLAASDWHAP